MVQELVFRVARTPLYAGGRWLFVHSTIRFADARPEGFLGSGAESNISGAGAVLTWDARDTLFARGPEEWAFYVIFGNGWR